MALPGLKWAGSLFQLAKAVSDVVEIQRKHAEALADLTAKHHQQQLYNQKLEAQLDRMVSEARSAAQSAATVAVSNISMTVGALQSDVRHLQASASGVQPSQPYGTQSILPDGRITGS